jgi:hypothetical protein
MFTFFYLDVNMTQFYDEISIRKLSVGCDLRLLEILCLLTPRGIFHIKFTFQAATQTVTVRSSLILPFSFI